MAYLLLFRRDKAPPPYVKYIYNFHINLSRLAGFVNKEFQWQFWYNCGNLNFMRRIMMAVTFYAYPKCGTCRKAKKWLEENNVDFNEIHIVENPPSKQEWKELYEKSGLELKKFFNTSGKKYRELGLKDRLKTATEDEMLELLASDGMLIKRPIVTDGKQVTVGFREEQFESIWKWVVYKRVLAETKKWYIR